MVVIFVQKAWLETIGDMAGELIIRSETANAIALFAGRVKINYPFVEAELVRKGEGKAFIPSHIPSAVITEMFDMTESEAESFGFHPRRS